MQPQPLAISDPAPSQGTGFALGSLALAARAEWLNRRWAEAPTDRILAEAIDLAFKDRIAVVSSFGAEAAVLLHLVAQVDKATPILFLETGKHFLETLTYRDILIDRFGFTDARSLEPSPADLAREDPAGDLWSKQPNRCCHLRKVEPLQRALAGRDAWLTGQRRAHGPERARLAVEEWDDARGIAKFNPLALWTDDSVWHYVDRHQLPTNPLHAKGYASIGCEPCTRAIHADEDPRAGRWWWEAGHTKECGLHITAAASAQQRVAASREGTP